MFFVRCNIIIGWKKVKYDVIMSWNVEWFFLGGGLGCMFVEYSYIFMNVKIVIYWCLLI